MKTTLLILLLLMAGCESHYVKLSNGTVIGRQAWFTKSSAEKLDFYYKDPNTTIWLVINDPCTAVNPGRLRFIEPRTGIRVEAEITPNKETGE